MEEQPNQSTSTKLPNTITCKSCNYQNGYWRSQCENCGATLGATSTSYAATSNSGRGSTWRWIAGVIGLIRLIALMARCSAESDTSYAPRYPQNYELSAFASPLETEIPLAINPLRLGTKVFANQTITVVQPLLWQVEMPDAASVEMTGMDGFLHIEWYDDSEIGQMWQMKQRDPQGFALVEDFAQNELRSKLESTASTLFNFATREPEQLQNMPILFGIYEVQMMIDYDTFTMIHFDTMCGVQRDCTFQYVHMGRQPLNGDEWEMLAQVANSLQFVGERAEKIDQPVSPLSPLLVPEKGTQL